MFNISQLGDLKEYQKTCIDKMPLAKHLAYKGADTGESSRVLGVWVVPSLGCDFCVVGRRPAPKNPPKNKYSKDGGPPKKIKPSRTPRALFVILGIFRFVEVSRRSWGCW